ncbi:MAG: ribosome maturation factor RimP [Acidimicrobiia bacterium]
MRASELDAAITSVVEDLGMRCYDIDWIGSGNARTLRVLVERDGGIDLDRVAETSRAISGVLDSYEAPGPYQLEVSSPGIERPLRRLEHFVAVVGSPISAKFRTETGVQRVAGTLTAVESNSDEAATIVISTETGEVAVPMSNITGAHVVFVWPSSPRQKGSR